MSHRTPETDAKRARIADWYRRKQELGTTKALARELGMSVRTVDTIIYRLRNQAPA